MQQIQDTSQTTPQMQCGPMPQKVGDMDFDIARTYLVLTATLVLPMYLALSVVSYSLGAIY
ncbi:MAG: hypothetical protein WC508_01385 [Patescibacteria group bacterium]